MDELKFRKKFERTENSKFLSENKNAISKVITTCKKMENSKDSSIRYMADNFSEIDVVYPYLKIFNDKNSGFRLIFSSLEISDSADDLTIAHEIGHMINGIKNTQYDELTHSPKISVPEKFEEIVKKAKHNCLGEENKEEFKSYIQHLCKDKEISDAEKGPLSDIMSAVFKTAGLRIGNKDNICMFPSHHSVFYDNNIDEQTRNEKIYDEIYANMYALKANNCEKELGLLEKFLGEDFINFYDNEISNCIEVFKDKKIEKENQTKVESLGDEVRNILPQEMIKVQKELSFDREETKEK